MDSAEIVPFLDVSQTYQELSSDITRAINRVLESDLYVLGAEVEQFEREFSSYCGSRFAVGVGNGLDALILALRAVGVQPGDEVVVPGHTFIATWFAVSHVGARPVPVEPDGSTFNINPDRIEEVISEKTSAIVPVHLYGQPADIDEVHRIASKYKLRVVEDAAQAHGAKYKGERVGASSDAVAWSFYPGKNLGAFGDGGCVTTNSPEVANRIMELRNYGSRTKNNHGTLGFNSRLDSIQAAVLRVKLMVLDEWNLRRQKIADMYSEVLQSDALELPEVPSWADPVWHIYAIQLDHRDYVIDRLREDGLEASVHYPTPPHLQAAYRNQLASLSLPISEGISRRVLSLPMGPHLSVIEAERIATAVNRLSRKERS